MVPPVNEIPWHAPVVPDAVAVIEIGCEAPDVAKFALEANPTPPLPLPVMDEVAVTVPAVVKAAVTLIPLPPVVPLLLPMQFVNVTGPLLVKAPAKFSPWLAVPLPPWHPAIVTVPSLIEAPNVTVPEDPVVQLPVILTPRELAPLELFVPLTLIGPVVVVRGLVADNKTPLLVNVPPGIFPATLMVPLPVDTPLLFAEITTPLELLLEMEDPIPIKVIFPLPVVLIRPVLGEKASTKIPMAPNVPAVASVQVAVI
jgi:hypothetical protein